MYVVFGIEKHGHVITEIFLKDKKNIMDRVMYVANIHDVVKIEVKEIIIDEDDEDYSEIIMTIDASYFKK